MSPRTLQRHKSAPVVLLDVQQSGRAWKFAEILAKATRVLGSQAEAEQWLRRQAIGLDQQRPIDLLTTPAGVKLVEDYLGRLSTTSIHDAASGGAWRRRKLLVWRLDQQIHAANWDSGEGAFRKAAVGTARASAPSTAPSTPRPPILEVAVHKGFKVLDTVPYVITAETIADAAEVHVINE